MFPDYRDTSPYQTRLAQYISATTSVDYRWPADVFSEAGSCTGRIFHLHWQNAVYARPTSLKDKSEEIDKFESGLRSFRARGGIFVWTVHNLLPHETQHPDLDNRMTALAARNADIIHVHNHETENDVVSIGASKFNVIRYQHPNFDGVYPSGVSQLEARKYLGLSEESIVYAFIGMVRKYKGIDILRDAFDELRGTCPNACLIVAGDQGRSQSKRVISSGGVYTIPRFVEDSTIQYILEAADYCVLPFRRITTSGSLILALGWGKPTIAPRLPQIEGDFADHKEVIFFEPDNTSSLVRALKASHDLPLSKYRAMRLAAKQSVGCFTYAGLSRLLIDKVAQVNARCCHAAIQCV